MPLVAAAGAFLGTAGGAALAGGALAAGGSIYAANQANSANKAALAAQQQATNAQLQLQQQQFDQVRQDQAPYRQVGYSALDALMQRMGLGGGTGGTPAPANQNGQFLDNAPGPEQRATSGGQPDYAAYVAQNPDILAEAQRVLAQNPNQIGDLNHDGRIDTTDYGQFHAATFHDRAVPTSAPTNGHGQAQTAEQQLQQQVGAEPTFASRETFNRPGYQQANVGLDQFQASPDYQFRLNEGSRNLNAFNAAKGVLGSGAAAKALVDYGQNTAASEYGNWRSYVTGQADKLNAFNQDSFNSDRAYSTDIYNTDRANSLNRYDTNRSYLTGRSDSATGNLFNLANLGQGANAQTAQAGSAYANNAGGIIQNNANAVSNAFSSTANTNAGLAGSLAGIGQSVLNAFAVKPPTPGTMSATPGGWTVPGATYTAPTNFNFRW